MSCDKAPTRPVNGSYPNREITVISNILKVELLWDFCQNWFGIPDMTYKELPPKASILYGLTTPKTGGIHFYNLVAYETMPAAIREKIKSQMCA